MTDSARALSLMVSALEADRGLTLQFTSDRERARFRSRFYFERKKAQKAGDDRFDDLSCVAIGTGGMQLIKRSRLKRIEPEFDVSVRPTAADELPETVRARGPHRPGIPLHLFLKDRI